MEKEKRKRKGEWKKEKQRFARHFGGISFFCWFLFVFGLEIKERRKDSVCNWFSSQNSDAQSRIKTLKDGFQKQSLSGWRQRGAWEILNRDEL